MLEKGKYQYYYTFQPDNFKSSQANSQKLEEALKRMVLAHGTLTICPCCKKSYIKYEGLGKYSCLLCHAQFSDDYGKVREFLDCNGHASLAEVSRATGVKSSTIKQMVNIGDFSLTSNVGF